MPFLSHVLFSLTHACSSCWNESEMSQEIEMKSESWDFCSFPKGAWEQRCSLITTGVILLSSLILGLDKSDPHDTHRHRHTHTYTHHHETGLPDKLASWCLTDEALNDCWLYLVSVTGIRQTFFSWENPRSQLLLELTYQLMSHEEDGVDESKW